MTHVHKSVVVPHSAPPVAAAVAELARVWKPASRATTPTVMGVAPGRANVRNRLLAALPADDLALLAPHLELVELEQHAQLFAPGQPIRHVYFPETVVVSLVNRLGDGRSVEVGTAGFEGMAGLSIFLADDTSSLDAVAQVSGTAHRIEASAFVRLTASSAPLHRLMLRYSQAFLTQVAQTAACNGSHLVQERCARWLLTTCDRVDGNDFALTHEFLAFMLGVRRAGVTVTLRGLQDAGVIAYTRGRISIVDRAALERDSCECYAVVRSHFDRLLQEPVVE